MFEVGVVNENEICPGVSWEDHAESVAEFRARFLSYPQSKPHIKGLASRIIREIDAEFEYFAAYEGILA